MLAGLLRWWSCCSSVLGTADVTYSWLRFPFKPRASSPPRDSCVYWNPNHPLLIQRQQQDKDPLRRFQGPVDPQGSCDKLLSTAPAVAQGCSVYSFLELGFVGFGSRWQHFACVQVSWKPWKSALGVSVYVWIYVKPSGTAFCKSCLGSLWADSELFRKHDLPGFVRDGWNLKCTVATVTDSGL